MSSVFSLYPENTEQVFCQVGSKSRFVSSRAVPAEMERSVVQFRGAPARDSACSRRENRVNPKQMSRDSQLRHSWHFGWANSLLCGAGLCPVGYLATRGFRFIKYQKCLCPAQVVTTEDVFRHYQMSPGAKMAPNKNH